MIIEGVSIHKTAKIVGMNISNLCDTMSASEATITENWPRPIRALPLKRSAINCSDLLLHHARSGSFSTEPSISIVGTETVIP